MLKIIIHTTRYFHSLTNLLMDYISNCCGAKCINERCSDCKENCVCIPVCHCGNLESDDDEMCECDQFN